MKDGLGLVNVLHGNLGGELQSDCLLTYQTRSPNLGIIEYTSEVEIGMTYYSVYKTYKGFDLKL